MSVLPVDPGLPDPARVHGAAPAFVSRSAASKSRADAPILASDGRTLPTLRDVDVRWMFALVVVLSAFAWWRVDGYQLADSVEFMERARTFVRGERMIDAGAIRPFGFSFLLVPFFALAEWFGIVDERALVWCVVVLQIALGGVLAWRCMRIGAMVAGRPGAIAAGFLAATNPVFMQYSTQPVSDIAAGVCIAFAVERLLERSSFRRALVAGLWLGVAFMMAYKTLLISLALLAVLFVRDRWKHSGTWRGIFVGVSVAVLLQSTLDWIMYGSFGASIGNYVTQNVSSIVTAILFYTYKLLEKFGIVWQGLYDFAYRFYLLSAEVVPNKPGVTTPSAIAKESPWYYVANMSTLIVWPAIGLLAAACVRLLMRPRSKAGLLFVAVFLCFFVMSYKGTKDLRLTLALLPLLAPFLGYGWGWLNEGVLARLPRFRAVLVPLGIVAVLGFSTQVLSRANVRHFGGYWAAMDWVNARARSTFDERSRASEPWLGRDHEPEPLRVGCAYNWAVFLRSSPLVKVVKLPWQLNLWTDYEMHEADGGRSKKGEDFAALEELDVFVVHLPILSQNHDLMRWVDAHFEVVGALYDQLTYEDLGPIYVLERRTGSSRARRFFDVTRGVSPEQFQRERQIERPLDFVDAAGTDRLELLGVEYTNVPPMDFGWITYHWRAAAPIARDYWVLDRVTSPDEHNVWENNHPFAYGNVPSSTWQAGDILSESYLMVPAHSAYESFGQVRPIGAAYRRGDRIPTRTWMKLRAFDGDPLDPKSKPTVIAQLSPARAGERAPIRAPDAHGVHVTPDGIQFSADDFVRVAAFFVPVLPQWRLPDDGKPLQD